MILQRIVAALITAVALSVSLTAAAQTYPSRPVRFVVASTGSPQDVIGRMFAQRIQENWGQPIVVENRAGAGALISIQTVVKSPADGYTVTIAAVAGLAICTGRPSGRCSED